MSRKYHTITEQEKDLIIKDYLSEMATRDIYDKWDIHSHQLYAILDEKNIPKRYPSKAINHEGYPLHIENKNNDSKTFKCPHCNRGIEIVKGARYCTFCGGDIRDKREIALERLNKLYLFVKEQPDAVAIVNDVAQLIKEM